MTDQPCPTELELDRALSVGAAPELIAHLGECEACRSTWDETRSAIELLRALPVELPPAHRREDRRSAILAAGGPVPADPRPRRPRWVMPAIWMPASLVAMILATLHTRPPAEVAPGDPHRGVVRARPPDELVRRRDRVMPQGELRQAAAAFNRAVARTSEAIASLRAFLDAYPASTRAGEALAMLGWLLVEAHELDEARRRFQAAENHPVP